MKLALVGTGRMGATVARLASGRGHEVIVSFDSKRRFLDAGEDELGGVDAIIEFTRPEMAVSHITHAVELGVPIVTGTTGWHPEIAAVQSAVEHHPESSVLHAANFSLGVALLRRALGSAMQLMNAIEDFDVAIHELHHTAKVDSPSGTAVLLANDILRAVDRKSSIETETVHGAIDPAALHVSSSRVGRVFGRHTITIDNETDEVILEHRAKSRDGFGAGAIRAAEWLVGRRGLFTLDDVIDSWTNNSQTSNL
jgi:4-hydroxy-tetrahydrodipicolinate reductase